MHRTNLISEDLISGQSRITFKTQADYLLFLAFVAIICIFVAILIFQLIGIGIFAYQVKVRGSKSAAITKSLEENKRVNENLASQIQNWQDKTNQLEQRINFLKEEIAQDILWSQVLEKLNSFIPARLWLVKLSLEKEAIIIKGNTYDNLLISTFISNLSTSDIFTNTNLNYTRKKKAKRSDNLGREVIEFEITCQLIIREPQESLESS